MSSKNSSYPRMRRQFVIPEVRDDATTAGGQATSSYDGGGGNSGLWGENGDTSPSMISGRVGAHGVHKPGTITTAYPTDDSIIDDDFRTGNRVHYRSPATGKKTKGPAQTTNSIFTSSGGAAVAEERERRGGAIRDEFASPRTTVDISKTKRGGGVGTERGNGDTSDEEEKWSFVGTTDLNFGEVAKPPDTSTLKAMLTERAAGPGRKLSPAASPTTSAIVTKAPNGTNGSGFAPLTDPKRGSSPSISSSPQVVAGESASDMINTAPCALCGVVFGKKALKFRTTAKRVHEQRQQWAVSTRKAEEAAIKQAKKNGAIIGPNSATLATAGLDEAGKSENNGRGLMRSNSGGSGFAGMTSATPHYANSTASRNASQILSHTNASNSNIIQPAPAPSLGATLQDESSRHSPPSGTSVGGGHSKLAASHMYSDVLVCVFCAQFCDQHETSGGETAIAGLNQEMISDTRHLSQNVKGRIAAIKAEAKAREEEHARKKENFLRTGKYRDDAADVLHDDMTKSEGEQRRGGERGNKMNPDDDGRGEAKTLSERGGSQSMSRSAAGLIQVAAPTAASEEIFVDAQTALDAILNQMVKITRNPDHYNVTPPRGTSTSPVHSTTSDQYTPPHSNVSSARVRHTQNNNNNNNNNNILDNDNRRDAEASAHTHTANTYGDDGFESEEEEERSGGVEDNNLGKGGERQSVDERQRPTSATSNHAFIVTPLSNSSSISGVVRKSTDNKQQRSTRQFLQDEANGSDDDVVVAQQRLKPQLSGQSKDGDGGGNTTPNATISRIKANKSTAHEGSTPESKSAGARTPSPPQKQNMLHQTTSGFENRKSNEDENEVKTTDAIKRQLLKSKMIAEIMDGLRGHGLTSTAREALRSKALKGSDGWQVDEATGPLGATGDDTPPLEARKKRRPFIHHSYAPPASSSEGGRFISPSRLGGGGGTSPYRMRSTSANPAMAHVKSSGYGTPFYDPSAVSRSPRKFRSPASRSRGGGNGNGNGLYSDPYAFDASNANDTLRQRRDGGGGHTPTPGRHPNDGSSLYDVSPRRFMRSSSQASPRGNRTIAAILSERRGRQQEGGADRDGAGRTTPSRAHAYHAPPPPRGAAARGEYLDFKQVNPNIFTPRKDGQSLAQTTAGGSVVGRGGWRPQKRSNTSNNHSAAANRSNIAANKDSYADDEANGSFVSENWRSVSSSGRLDLNFSSSLVKLTARKSIRNGEGGSAGDAVVRDPLSPPSAPSPSNSTSAKKKPDQQRGPNASPRRTASPSFALTPSFSSTSPSKARNHTIPSPSEKKKPSSLRSLSPSTELMSASLSFLYSTAASALYVSPTSPSLTTGRMLREMRAAHVDYNTELLTKRRERIERAEAEIERIRDEALTRAAAEAQRMADEAERKRAELLKIKKEREAAERRAAAEAEERARRLEDERIVAEAAARQLAEDRAAEAERRRQRRAAELKKRQEEEEATELERKKREAEEAAAAAATERRKKVRSNKKSSNVHSSGGEAAEPPAISIPVQQLAFPFALASNNKVPKPKKFVPKSTVGTVNTDDGGGYLFKF